MPVASYAPELLQLFQRAAQEPVSVTLTSTNAAFSLRFRLHRLRKEMRREHHPLTTLANGIQISIYGNVLTAKPADQSYLTALHAAGIEVMEPPLPSTAKAAPLLDYGGGPGDDGEDGSTEINQALSNFFTPKKE